MRSTNNWLGRRYSKMVLAAAVCAGLGSVAAIPAHAQDAMTAMASNPQLSQWQSLVQFSGLGGKAATATFTVFALTDEGFDNLNGVWKGKLTQRGANQRIDRQLLQSVVRSQAVAGLYPPSAFAGKVTTLSSLNGTPIVVDGTGPNGLKITMAYATSHPEGPPIVADNAIIYPVLNDSVHP